MEVITTDDVITADKHVEAEQGIHIRKDDVEWPSALPLKLATLESERSPPFRNQLMLALNDAFETIRAVPAWRKVLTCRGADLLEVARYEWFFGMCSQAHRGWIIEQILERFSPQTLIWVSPQELHPSIETRQFQKILTGREIIFHHFRFGKNVPKGKSLDPGTRFWKLAAGDIKYSFVQVLRSVSSRSRSNTLDLKNENKILFVENFPNSAKASAAVARALQEFDDVAYQFVATRPSVMDAVKGIQRLALLSEITPPRVWIESACKQLQVSLVAQRISRTAVFRNRMLSNAALLNRREFAFAAAKSWRNAAMFCCLCNNLIRKYRPRVIATTSIAGSFARASVDLAKRQGASSFLVQHGMFYLDDYEKHILQDSALVWGERDKRKWIQAGFSEKRITVTGSPKFDRLSRLSASVDQPQPSPAKLFRVGYFPSMSGGSTVSLMSAQRMLFAVISAVQSLGQTKLTIKVKAEDNCQLFEKIELGEQVRVIRDRAAYDVILESDVVIVSTSTVGLEACALDRPVIVLAFPGVRVNEAYEEYGSALIASTETEIEAYLKSIREDRRIASELNAGRGRLVCDMFGGLVTDSSTQGAEIIAQEARRSSVNE